MAEASGPPRLTDTVDAPLEHIPPADTSRLARPSNGDSPASHPAQPTANGAPVAGQMELMMDSIPSPPQLVLHPAPISSASNPPVAINTATATPTDVPAPHVASERTVPSILYAWIWEILACLLAVSIVVVEVVLLRYYDQELADAWNHTWKINSMFAFLTTNMEACVAFAIAACLGQLRWLWYRQKDKELWWMDRLTNARMPSGAVHFLINPASWRHWATLGAVLVVALLGIGVFTQEVIGHDLVSAPWDAGIGSCAVPIARNWLNQWQYGAQDDYQMPYMNMIAAINAGFMQGHTPEHPDTVIDQVRCDSGNCNFTRYSTLAVCSSCVDVSARIAGQTCSRDGCTDGGLLSVTDSDLTLDLNDLGWVNVTSIRGPLADQASIDTTPLIATYQGIGFGNSTRPAYAAECKIYWCVQDQNATMQGGQYREQLLASTGEHNTTVRQNPDTRNIEILPTSCWIEGFEHTGVGCTFTIGPSSHAAIQNYLSGTDEGDAFLDGSVRGEAGTLFWRITSLAAEAISDPCSDNTRLDDCTDAMFAKFNWTITNMTLAMTNAIRTTAKNGTLLYSRGAIYEDTLSVKWPWLAYPITVVCLSIIFLGVTIWKSRGVEPWKSSVVALMIHGIHAQDLKKYFDPDDPKAMENAHNTWSVQLRKENGMQSFRWQENKRRSSKFNELSDKPSHAAEHVGDAAFKALDNA